MEKICALLLLAGLAVPAYPGAMDDLPGARTEAGPAAIPVPAVFMDLAGPSEKAPVPACPQNMRGDRNARCSIATRKTTVCSDGQRIDVSRVTEKDVKSGRFSRSELGIYKDLDLRSWASHQKSVGGSSRWGDGSHQSMLATGRVNPITTPYVVLPNREWLGRDVTVCVKATGACVEARALEVGPRSTFRDHSELSVGALMALGLNAHPDSGTYNGEITFTFH